MFARLATDQEPDLLSGYLELLSISLFDKNHDETLAMLRQIDQKFHLPRRDLTALPPYAEFIRSPQYKQWIDHLAQPDKARDRKERETTVPAVTDQPRSAKSG